MRFSLSPRIDVAFTPGDWLVLSVLGALLIAGLYGLFASLSLALTTEVPARGGTYHEVIVGTPRFINPVLALSDADRDLVALVHAGLMRATPDGSVVPDLAESYTISEDARTYTFTLHEDARFHDGTQITADDVAFTVTLAQNPTLKSVKRANWEGVAVSVVDERTVSFTLNEPYALFLDNARLGILPRHLWENIPVDAMPFSSLNIEPVGAGPFSLSRTEKVGGVPSSMTLEAFDGVRTPYLSTIELIFVTDSTAAYATLEDTRIGAHSLPPESLTEHSLFSAVMGRVFGVYFNQNGNALFADATVRAALDTAIDKKTLIDTIIGGYGSPLSGPVPPDSLDPRITEFGLEKARALLDANGWKVVDGVYQKKIKSGTTRFSFTLSTGEAPELRAAAEYVAATWRELPADVTIEFFEAQELESIIRPRKYEALLFGQVVGSDADLYAFWDSSQRNDPGLNIALYTNSAVDTLVRAARAESDPTERRELITKAAEKIGEEYAAVFLYSPHFVYLVPKTLHGVILGTITTPADRFRSVHEWYMNQERVWPFLKSFSY